MEMNKTLIGIITLAALATVAHAQFTEIGNPQHYGRINIPKAYGVIDANFAHIAASINGATAIALTPADAGGSTGTVTVAITDISGDPVDALVSWWISNTSGGAASATNVDAVSITTGTAIIAESSTIVNSAVSTGGALVIEVDMTAAGTNYVSVAVGGLLAEATLITEE